MSSVDMVNHPPHYNSGTIEVIDAVESISSCYPQEISYHIGNVVKYIARAPYKNGIEDLKKALWYIRRAKYRVNLDGYLVEPSKTEDIYLTFAGEVANSYELLPVQLVVNYVICLLSQPNIPVRMVCTGVESALKKIVLLLESDTE